MTHPDPTPATRRSPMLHEATHPALAGWHYDPADYAPEPETDEPDLDDIPDDELEWDARILIDGEWTVLWRGDCVGARERAERHAADARAGTQYPATVVVSCRRPR